MSGQNMNGVSMKPAKCIDVLASSPSSVTLPK
ncbi:MAG: Uncharacterised protein [Methanobacteriota archaeon]|nr:MAG: Uncharacterised protein [Euryarchaeota archaeon]